MKLYELEQQFLNLLDLLDNAEGDEFLEGSLEAIEGEIEVKIDNIACLIKQLQSESKALKDEANSLIERAMQKQNKAQKLTEYIENTMFKINKNKIETNRNLLQIKKNPASVIIEDGFMDWAKNNYIDLIRVKTIEEPDKVKIKEFLQANDCDFAKLQQKEKLVIK